MTDNHNNPDFNVYIVTPAGEQDIWHRVGAAWLHSNREGLNIRLDYPVAVTDFVLRPPKNDNAG